MNELRKIRVISTQGGVRMLELPNGIVLEDLLSFFRNQDISVEGMKIMVVQNKTTLELPDAIVPDGDITISLSQAKIKAGAVTYQEMKAFVKEARRKAETENDSATLNLIGDYTRLTSAAMTELYSQLQQRESVVESVNSGIVERVEKLEAIIKNFQVSFKNVLDVIERLEKMLDEEDEDMEEDFEEDDGLTDEEREFLNRL